MIYRQQLEHRVNVQLVFLDLASVSDRLLQVFHVYIFRPTTFVMVHLVVPEYGGCCVHLRCINIYTNMYKCINI